MKQGFLLPILDSFKETMMMYTNCYMKTQTNKSLSGTQNNMLSIWVEV